MLLIFAKLLSVCNTLPDHYYERGSVYIFDKPHLASNTNTRDRFLSMGDQVISQREKTLFNLLLFSSIPHISTENGSIWREIFFMFHRCALHTITANVYKLQAYVRVALYRCDITAIYYSDLTALLWRCYEYVSWILSSSRRARLLSEEGGFMDNWKGHVWWTMMHIFII